MKNPHHRLLLITPPFTQLNTPYPATAYLKGFLNTQNISSRQMDLGIEVILSVFSKKGLSEIFELLGNSDIELSENAYRIYSNRTDYLSCIEPVINFLQNKNPTLAHFICGGALPEAGRFENMEDLEWAFGTMGIQDKARHLATRFLEDLGDLIKEAIDPHFGFSRYAERLGRTATHFDELDKELNAADSLITASMFTILNNSLKDFQPNLVCLSVPFPGNLFAALKCGQFIKKNYPQIKIVLGGGFANTELRRLSDERVFNYIDFVSLDDGELPLLCLLEHLEGKRGLQHLKRMFTCINKVVTFCNNAPEKDIPQREVGTPDYSDLRLFDYLSVIDIINPMHRLWSDGRWNKLTLAHGCYWGKCSFCDVSLDYIGRYEPVNAEILCDRIETIIQQTGQNGFHFVDEAAPPALMRDLAIEIIKRKIVICWWTNIRFEKSFSPDLCRLLKASGCIAVSGGLEVASDRLLSMMKKGVTVAQVTAVGKAFTDSGIMVHAYLMYGFPTQTAQETVDSLEMVRQLFAAGVIQSGFWHQFAMTAHSPVGLNPEQYFVEQNGPLFGGFAENDYYHLDPKGTDHEDFAEGLRISLFNYMQGAGLDLPLSKWFNFKIPKTKVLADYIENILAEHNPKTPKPADKLYWSGKKPEIEFFSEKGKNGVTEEYAALTFAHKSGEFSVEMPAKLGKWLQEALESCAAEKGKMLLYSDFKNNFKTEGLEDFTSFINSGLWKKLTEMGLLIL
jgi:hypothetical protein